MPELTAETYGVAHGAVPVGGVPNWKTYRAVPGRSGGRTPRAGRRSDLSTYLDGHLAGTVVVVVHVAHETYLIAVEIDGCRQGRPSTFGVGGVVVVGWP